MTTTHALTGATAVSHGPGTTNQRTGRTSKLARRQALRAYGFIAPSVVILGAFMAWPLISSLRLSFYKSSGFGPDQFLGLGNYRTLAHDPVFLADLGRTLLYAVVVTPVTVGLSLVFAVMLNRRMAGRSFFRAAIFLPAVLSLGVMSIAWDFLIDPNIGMLPRWLAPLHISLGNGVADPHLALVYVMAVGVWKNVGFYMVMYLAGLATIPTELYEAASIDGAGPWHRFSKITWPLLSNTSMFVFVIAAIAALQAFDQVYVMTRGGPFFQTETLVYLIYRKGFGDFDFGYASAVSWVLLVIVFIISMGQNWYFSRRQVTY